MTNKYIKQESTLKKLIRKSKKAIKILFYVAINRTLCFILKLDDKKVLFFSDVRDKLGGNFEFVYNYITNPELKKVTVFKKTKKEKRKFIEKFRAAYELSTAKYVILEDASIFTMFMKVRKGQHVVQLGHGSGALKMIGASRSDLKNISNQHRNYTKTIVGTIDEKWIYAEAYRMPMENVIPAGFARTDPFFDKNWIAQKTNELHEEFPWMKGKTVILFAPTFRGTKTTHTYYDLDKIDFDKIYSAFDHDKYVFIIKWHPSIYNCRFENGINNLDFEKYDGFYQDFSELRDINDLLPAADILITDYSSVMFDYVFLDRPMINFVYDLEEYSKERGLYCDYSEYVFCSMTKTTDELIEALQAPVIDEEKRKKFINRFMGACDGNSTKKTCDEIFGDVKYR